MAIRNQVLDMIPIGMRFTVVKAAADTQGQSLELHWELLPGCNMKDPLVHIHPYAIETYEILEGEMEFFIKDKWISATKGDQLIVPKGVHHAFRNPSGKMVRVFNTHQPAFRMEQYFEEVCLVLDKLTEKQTKDFTMNFNAKLYMGVLMNRFRHEIIAKDPPDVMIRVLGTVGKWMGLTY